MKKKKIYGIHIGVSLILGAVFYLFFSPDTIVSQMFFHIAGNESVILLTLPDTWWANVANWYVCDWLWGYALTFVLALILGTNTKGLLKTISVAGVFEAIVEYMQRIGIFVGTFDVNDILVEWMATLVAVLILQYMNQEETR